MTATTQPSGAGEPRRRQRRARGTPAFCARARRHPGRRPARPAGHGGQRPPPHPGRHPVDPGRHRRAGPGPRHLGRARHPDHRRQPLRPHRVAARRSARGATGRSTPIRRWPGRSSRFLARRRPAGHPPDRHPRAGLRRTDPDGGRRRRGRSGVEQLGPVDLHLQTATGIRVVRVEPGEHAYASGCSGARDRVRPGAPTPSPGSSGPSPAGRGWRIARRPVRRGRAVAGRPQPAERPLGAVPLRGLAHPLPAVRPLRLVAARPLRRGRPAAGGGHPLGARPPRHRGCRPGPSATPTRPTSATRSSSPRVVALVVLVVLAVVLGLLSRRMWSILGGGALDEVQAEAGANDTARDAGRRLVGPGLRRPDHRGHLPVRAHPSRARASTPTSGATAEVVEEHRGPARPAAGLPAQPAGQLGRARDRGRAPRPACCWPATSCRSPSVLERVVTRGRHGGTPPSRARRLLPDGRLVAARARPPPGPPADPPGAAVGGGRHPVRRASSTCSTPSPRRCAAGSTCARAVPPAPGQRGRRGAGRHGRARPDRPRPGHPPGPAAGLAGVGGPARPSPSSSTSSPAPTSRSRCSPWRVLAFLLVNRQGVPGRLGLVLAALGPRRPRGRRRRHHPA